MATLTGPAAVAVPAPATATGVRILDAAGIESVRASVQAWLDSHGVAELARLSDRMLMTRATLVPVTKLQLRTRYETRSVASKTEALQRGAVPEKRNFRDDSFPIWDHIAGASAADMQPGMLPPAVTKKVRYSDLVKDCAACGAAGSTRCAKCGGQGQAACRSCGGGREVDCSACSGAGEKKCWTCNGYGERKCDGCRSGTRHNGERCTLCHGRGYTRCNECRDGIKACGACSRRGSVRCATCDAAGQVRCGGCSGEGRIACTPCAGSGTLVTSLHLTASHAEKLADAWVLPPEYAAMVPEEVSAWLQRHVEVGAACELSAQQFDGAPGLAQGAPATALGQAGQRLIEESKRHVRYRSNLERVDVSSGPVERIVRQWYTEYALPLVKVEYLFDGGVLTLWTVAPGLATADHEQGYARKGSAVFASEGPVTDYAGQGLAAAAAALENGRLGECGRRAGGLLQAFPGLTQAASLQAAAVRSQRICASIGSLLAVAGAVVLYMAMAPMPPSAIAMVGIGCALLAAAAPFALKRVVYRTRTAALLAQCALVGAMLVPAVAGI